MKLILDTSRNGYAVLFQGVYASSYPIQWSLVQSGKAEGEISISTADLLNPIQKASLRMRITTVAEGERVGVDGGEDKS